MNNKSITAPPVGLALLPLIAMIGLLVIGYGVYGLPIESLLLTSAVIAAAVAWKIGYSWDDIQNAIIDRLAKTLPAVFILVLVGGLIGSWMVGGTIPMLVYYGLKIISPEYLVLTSFLVTCMVSLCTGTSWGSAGTIGVALMGIATGMDANLAAVAGAVVSGAYFGDKISPLSDSTNFAPVVAGTDLYSHIQHMLWTTIPAFILSAVVFFFVGSHDVTADTPEKVIAMLANIEQLFSLNIFLLLPPALILWGAIRKLPTIPLMLLAIAIGIFNAVTFQGFSLVTALTAMLNGFNASMFADAGLSNVTVVSDVLTLVNRGGMTSMMGVVLLVFCAFSFAGALALTGALNVLVDLLSKGIKGTASLIGATIVTTITVVCTTSDGKLALLIPSELFRDTYKRMQLDPKNLSRTIEDAGTIIEPLVPWTNAGVFMAATLGVSTLDYMPWAIQNYSAIFFAMLWAVTGVGIAKAVKEVKQTKTTTQTKATV
ncbi:TPA: Na+/H+ antiporter NhaC [Photobacterium damselae]|uniref:Na+/H+ antiporter NhaC n=1 Tax=Photobacterium damselae subsp. damselae TaxID=85581 RepID=A0AAD3WWT3_PHODD|nr:Na+/H+ antiporter NhaC [Photobacterium damselae]KAB1182633.1 Na+/H+ antiporter NhaC [Photobacterium damselae subsp. damselae]KAB1183966.1 Na+/H+ antiporter NhaC [Photobacterium damselae subsp. damselae]MBF7098834.1 Na+/H+ antiporter NhaC [Photobacterium damselae]NVO59152.1 Na+/H+ antiporter NhaC [Photobacterium damselae subsp. damselae]QSH58824.1 Na+/H+ antiporter NhaC [Photobacterium damselae subsp. damselae]